MWLKIKGPHTAGFTLKMYRTCTAAPGRTFTLIVFLEVVFVSIYRGTFLGIFV